MKFLRFLHFLLRWRHSFCSCHQKSAIPGNVVALFLSSSVSCSWQIYWTFSLSEHWFPCCSFCKTSCSSFFCLFLLIIVSKPLQLSVEWLYLPCRIQYFLFGWCSTEDSSLDSTTLDLDSSCLRFLRLFLFVFLEATEDFSSLPWAPNFLL